MKIRYFTHFASLAGHRSPTVASTRTIFHMVMITSTGHQHVPIRWHHLPRGTCQKASNTSDGHNFGKCWPIRTKLGSVMYVNTPNQGCNFFNILGVALERPHSRWHKGVQMRCPDIILPIRYAYLLKAGATLCILLRLQLHPQC